MENNVEIKRKWTSEEDRILRHYVSTHGAHSWDTVATNIGIGRSGNSCRLRWVNYLSPDLDRGAPISDQEMLQILTLHSQLGNRWVRIAELLPGRTDNDVKNIWNTRVKKEAKRRNCNVESKEFLQIMTAMLTERIQSAAAGGDDYLDHIEYIYDHVANGTDYTADR